MIVLPYLVKDLCFYGLENAPKPLNQLPYSLADCDTKVKATQWFNVLEGLSLNSAINVVVTDVDESNFIFPRKIKHDPVRTGDPEGPEIPILTVQFMGIQPRIKRIEAKKIFPGFDFQLQGQW
ncbi:MAG: hypothetical protein AAB455_00020 [Patescibacteria group bacterium]